MVKRRGSKKKSQFEAERLGPEERHELDLVLDRLRVQCPEGDSLEHCLQSFRATLTGRPLLVAALLERLSREPTPVTHRAYLALKDLVANTTHERVVKQADYRFRLRGFEAPTEEWSRPRPQRAALVPGVASPSAEALIVVESNTRWWVAVLLPRPSGSFQFVAFVRDFQGLIEYFKTFECDARGYREYLRRVKESNRAHCFKVPVWHAARLWFETLNKDPERFGSTDLEQVNSLLRPHLEPDRRPYPHEVLPEIVDPDAAVEALDVDQVLKRLSKAVGSSLALPKELVRLYWERILAVDQSVLVVSPEIKQARVDDLIANAVDALYDSDRRRLTRRYLEEWALCLWQRQRRTEALEAWALAQHLRTLVRPSSSRLLRNILVSSCYAHWPDRSGYSDPDEPSTEARQQDGLHRTEAGLILL